MPEFMENMIYSKLVTQCKTVAGVDIESLDTTEFAKRFKNIPVVYLYSSRDEYVGESDSMEIFKCLSTSFKLFIDLQASHSEERREVKINKVFDFLAELRKLKAKTRRMKEKSSHWTRKNKRARSIRSKRDQRREPEQKREQVRNTSAEKRLADPIKHINRNTMEIYQKNSKRNLKIRKIERVRNKTQKHTERKKQGSGQKANWHEGADWKEKEASEREANEDANRVLSSRFVDFFEESLLDAHKNLILNTRELTEKFQDLKSELRNVKIQRTKPKHFLNESAKKARVEHRNRARNGRIGGSAQKRKLRLQKVSKGEGQRVPKRVNLRNENGELMKHLTTRSPEPSNQPKSDDSRNGGCSVESRLVGPVPEPEGLGGSKCARRGAQGEAGHSESEEPAETSEADRCERAVRRRQQIEVEYKLGFQKKEAG